LDAAVGGPAEDGLGHYIEAEGRSPFGLFGDVAFQMVGGIAALDPFLHLHGLLARVLHDIDGLVLPLAD
jgi:hypothetical protein